MPDSLLPISWGSASSEGRDLDAMLSSDRGALPEAQRPVQDAMWALLAAPSASELSGEEAARAAFRALRTRADEAGHTRVLPLVVPAAPRRKGGHRRPRTAVRSRAGVRSPVLLLSAAAAAAVVIGGVALSGITGSIHLSNTGHQQTSPGGSPGGASGGGGLVAGASPQPSARVSPSHLAAISPADDTPAASPQDSAKGKIASDCRQYFAFWGHQEAKGSMRHELELQATLIREAGGIQHLYAFCQPYLGGDRPPLGAAGNEGGNGGHGQSASSSSSSQGGGGTGNSASTAGSGQ